MSAGTGISHSEYNASQTEPVHFLQIWIIPDKAGLPPGYEQRAFPVNEHQDRWILVASKGGRAGSVTVHQDADVWAARFSPGGQASIPFKPSRNIWTQVVGGAVTLNGTSLAAGDGAAIREEQVLQVRAVEAAELLMFDLP
jgi:redox-sensitive bicupin YhaK (pirin superfamily)